MEREAPSRKEARGSRRSSAFLGVVGGFPRLSRTSLKVPGEDDEEEEENSVEEEASDGTKGVPAPVGASLGTGGPTLAQSDPSLLAIMQHMTQIMANLQAASSSDSSRPPAFKTSSMKVPECFYGTRPFKFRSFIQSCQLIFHNDMANFSQDRKKVLNATSFLIGRAAKWIEPYLSNLTNQDPSYLLNSWKLHESQLFTLFGDPNEVRKAEAELDYLQMKGGHVSLYIADFRSLVILDQLASNPSSIDSLQDLMDITLELDTSYHVMQKEKNNHEEKNPEASKSIPSHSQNSSSSSHKKKKNIQKTDKLHSSLLNKDFKLMSSEKEKIIKEGLCTYCARSDQKDYYDPSNSFSNDISSAKSCAVLVGDSRTPSIPSSVHIPSLNSHLSLLSSRDEVFKEIQDVGEDNSVSSLHLFCGNMGLPPSSYHDSLEELWDEEEEPEEVETMLKVFPSVYHQYLDVFSKVKAEKCPPHRACDHHIELEGSLPPVGVIYSLSNQEKNKYPVPPMNQLLNFLNGLSNFSKIYLRCAYNLLRIKEGDEHLTAFRTKYGSYEYLVMPFGLTNSPASFENLVKDIFQDLLDFYVVVYLDDIMVFYKSQEEHVPHVSTVLSRLRANNLFAKASKCLFHVSSVEYLGYVVSSEGLKMDQENVQQILNWPPPRNLKALQSFLGFTNFYHHFIKNYSKKISSLTSFFKKYSCFPLNEEALKTDASDYSLGAVLSQISDSGKHPIEFDSCKLLPAELNYVIHDKELLGIVFALKHWRALLLSLLSSFKVLTNHSSLQYLMSSKLLTCRQARWAEFLTELHFSITYCPGRLATLPDALSHWVNVYPERGEYLISKNPMNYQEIIK
ncbi:hypothetical protein O181_015526 [Austropuccinia psidii MF-1]|uniref:Reverse transcriptase domain-containing protein n=1 Tax=Austropuccinia psidii MF-1 TaxID=1389203 RepID=A0A9Q3GQ69_9BASI|nr:hypothetical protein [Austropuccinia psidii MF-1]